ncbi:MAG: hypothetical protein GPJ54_00475 [Candidatus Heimdallarchaeota archaeon]|nr:hypothetical protein [Candidatus Heimdallarchaeota archaeon]
MSDQPSVISKIKPYFILTRNSEDLPDVSNFTIKLSWIILVSAGLLASFRDFFVYAITERNYGYNSFEPITYNYDEALLHAVFEFFMVILFYKFAGYVYQLLYLKNEGIQQEIRCDIFYVVQYSIIKDVIFLLFVGVRAIENNIFPRYDIWLDNPQEPLAIYWNIYMIYILLTVIYFMRGIVERMKLSYRNFNNLLVVSHFISLIALGICWFLVWIVRLLLSLPFGKEFYS